MTALRPDRPALPRPLWLLDAAPDAAGEHRPRLLCAGAGAAWPGTPCRRVGEAVLMRLGDRAVLVSLGGAVAVVADGEGRVSAWGDAGAAWWDGAALHVAEAGPLGPLGAARRTGSAWALPGHDLFEGAARARRLVVWPAGDGLMWEDLGWLYRWSAARGAEVIAALPRGARWTPGPRGAALIGDAQGWELCVGADGRRVALELPGDAPLAWLDGAPAALSEPVGGVVVTVGDDAVCGPGGRCWSSAGAPFGPALAAGEAAVALSDRVAVVDADGLGRWVDRADGADLGRFSLPLRRGPVSGGAADGDEAVFWSADGQAWRVSGERARPARAVPDHELADEALADLGFDLQAAGSGGVLAATSDGALVRAPR